VLHKSQTCNSEPPQDLHAPSAGPIVNLIHGYIFAQGALLFAAMSFACESSLTVCTTGSIVMNMNVSEHQSRVLVKSQSRAYTGRAASPDPGH
jgi:hypothetical protein